MVINNRCETNDSNQKEKRKKGEDDVSHYFEKKTISLTTLWKTLSHCKRLSNFWLSDIEGSVLVLYAFWLFDMEGRKKCAPLEEGDYDSSERTKKVKLPYLSLKKKNSLLS